MDLLHTSYHLEPDLNVLLAGTSQFQLVALAAVDLTLRPLQAPVLERLLAPEIVVAA